MFNLVVKASEIVASQPEERGEFFDRLKARSIAIQRFTPSLMALRHVRSEMNQLTAYTLRLGDNSWCSPSGWVNGAVTHRNWKSSRTGKHWPRFIRSGTQLLIVAAELAGEGDEDTLAFTRDEPSSATYCWLNNQTAILPTPLTPVFHRCMACGALYPSDGKPDPQLAAISAKAIKEARYHLLLVVAGWSDWAMVLTYQGKRAAGHQQVVAFYRRTVRCRRDDIALSEEGIAVDPRTLRAAWKPKFLPGSTKPH